MLLEGVTNPLRLLPLGGGTDFFILGSYYAANECLIKSRFYMIKQL